MLCTAHGYHEYGNEGDHEKEYTQEEEIVCICGWDGQDLLCQAHKYEDSSQSQLAAQDSDDKYEDPSQSLLAAQDTNEKDASQSQYAPTPELLLPRRKRRT